MWRGRGNPVAVLQYVVCHAGTRLGMVTRLGWLAITMHDCVTGRQLRMFAAVSKSHCVGGPSLVCSDMTLVILASGGACS